MVDNLEVENLDATTDDDDGNDYVNMSPDDIGIVRPKSGFGPRTTSDSGFAGAGVSQKNMIPATGDSIRSGGLDRRHSSDRNNNVGGSEEKVPVLSLFKSDPNEVRLPLPVPPRDDTSDDDYDSLGELTEQITATRSRNESSNESNEHPAAYDIPTVPPKPLRKSEAGKTKAGTQTAKDVRDKRLLNKNGRETLKAKSMGESQEENYEDVNDPQAGVLPADDRGSVYENITPTKEWKAQRSASSASAPLQHQERTTVCHRKQTSLPDEKDPSLPVYPPALVPRKPRHAQSTPGTSAATQVADTRENKAKSETRPELKTSEEEAGESDIENLFRKERSKLSAKFGAAVKMPIPSGPEINKCIAPTGKRYVNISNRPPMPLPKEEKPQEDKPQLPPKGKR